MSDLGYQLAVRDVRSRGDAESFYRLGSWLLDRKLWGVAAGCFARVVELEPGDFRGWANLGWCQYQAGCGLDGARSLRKALEWAPNDASPHALLSQVELMLGNVEFAIAEAREGVRLEPADSVNHLALSLALMRGGQWEEGWLEYEHRVYCRIPELTTLPGRWWRGEWAEHLYIQFEQGAGDGIFALRWVPLAAALVDRVTLYIHQGLYSLVDSTCRLPGNVEVYPLPRPLPEYDAYCPAMSLPEALGIDEPFFPGAYIVRYGMRNLVEEPKWWNVAIAWSGDPTHENARHRDIPLEEFLPLSEVTGVRLHSVQMGEGQKRFAELQCYGLIEDRSPEITNFEDTAKILAGMDLVISVDTAVAHLAGAMGLPVWMLANQRGADFRWGMKGETTPWYKTMRLFRRELDEDWAAVMRRVVAALRRLAGGELGDSGSTSVGSEDAVGVRGSGSAVLAAG